MRANSRAFAVTRANPVTNAARRDPEVIRADEASLRTETPRDPAVLEGRLLVGDQQHVKLPHSPEHRIVRVVESLAEFP